jgi:hypothetical protein
LTTAKSGLSPVKIPTATAWISDAISGGIILKLKKFLPVNRDHQDLALFFIFDLCKYL